MTLLMAQMLVALGLLATSGTAALPPEAPTPISIPIPTIRILVTNDAHLSPRLLVSAQATAVRLYREVGIRIEWIDHIAADLPLVVAFPPAGGAERLQVGINAMGYTFRTEQPRAGGRALVFYDRVERRAQTSQTDLGRLLGAVMAHEIGHMLLPDAHSPQGLMRGIWNDRDLTLISMEFLRFTAVERSRMQSELGGIQLTAARLPD
jgi:hypothetical protein